MPISSRRTKKKVNPLELSGLTQAIYVLKSLEDGMYEGDIIDQFGDHKQLVQIWISFLFHKGWMEHPKSGKKWKATDKGKRWIAARQRPQTNG